MSDQPILFYDGDCGLCHRFVLFVLKHEREPLFQFAPLGGPTFVAAFAAAQADTFPDSLILATGEGTVLTLSDAAVYALKTLSPGWCRVGKVIGVLPRPIRDLGYRSVAAVRRKLFKQPKGACPLVPVELRGRFQQ
jgi:predicted DCC family thiol-disulfide oxidoreductase YuxK